jgi:DNA-binding NarL/FixJ family response regulator
MSTTILLVDDHRVLRRGLRALLSDEPPLEVIGEAGDGREGIELARELAPDVVVMDVAMPGLNGATATRRIIEESDSARVIALSMHSDRRYVSEMLAAGASGYLLKSCETEELVLAIKTVAAGRTYLSPEIAGEVVHGYVHGRSPDDRTAAPDLSGREKEVLQLLAEGRTSKEIAHDLHVSPKTVTAHRQNIMDKVGIRSVAELTKYAIREGLTSLEV